MSFFINWKFVPIKEFNYHLKIANETSKVVILNTDAKDSDIKFLNYSYLTIKKVKAFLIYYSPILSKKVYVWSYLDKDRESIELLGSQAFSIFRKYVRIEDIQLDLKAMKVGSILDLGTISSFMFFNENYNFTKQIAYEYDINSAFASQCFGLMPTKFLRRNDVAKDGEVGFIYDDDGELVVNRCWFEPSEFVFKLGNIDGFSRFFKVYYDRKEKAKEKGDKIKKSYYKSIINMTIGYFQKINPFLRSYIISNLNNRMLDLVSKYYDHVLLSNVDSLITNIDLSSELPISDECGGFKIMREKEPFFLYSYNYQWNNEPPTYRGTPSAWFENYKKINKKSFDLSETSVSSLSVLYNKYRLDVKKMQFVKEF